MVEYATTKTLKPSTEPMAHHPLAQRTVAEVGTALRAARLLLYEAATVRMAGEELPPERWHRDSLAGPVMPPANERCLETAGKLLCGLQAATLEFQ
jgi:alkylation response protein AidB-like acyl-CoA dehydrogenase